MLIDILTEQIETQEKIVYICRCVNCYHTLIPLGSLLICLECLFSYDHNLNPVLDWSVSR